MSLPFPLVAVVGSGHLATEIIVLLLQAGHEVLSCPLHHQADRPGRLEKDAYLSEELGVLESRLRYVAEIEALPPVDLVIVETPEDLSVKQTVLRKITRTIPSDVAVAVNSESYSLEELRSDCINPLRIIGLNWVRPAHLTLFSELMVLPDTPVGLVEKISHLSENYWDKDPYVVREGKSIRSRLLAAMIREAFFLISEGYVGVEDIDRACRNDAGYYMSFAGNLRYMDLMGTYLYGLVMKDLNKELAKNNTLPEFFRQILKETPKPGMSARKGFYRYGQEDADREERAMLEFAEKIRDLMDRFPFPRERFFNEAEDVKKSMAFAHKNRSL